MRPAATGDIQPPGEAGGGSEMAVHDLAKLFQKYDEYPPGCDNKLIRNDIRIPEDSLETGKSPHPEALVRAAEPTMMMTSLNGTLNAD